MKRKYNDEEIQHFFTHYKSIENNEEMMRHILKDKRSLDYLDLLSAQEDMEADQEARTDTDKESVRKMIEDDSKLRNIISKIESKHIIRPLPMPDEPAFGQIYETSLPLNWPYPAQERRMVVVLSNTEGCFDPEHPDVLVALISFDVKNACDTDLLIPNAHSVFNDDFLIRFGDLQNMFTSQLKRFYGKIQEQFNESIKNLWKYSIGVKEINEQELDFPSISGPEDERYAFSLKEHEVTEYLRDPVNRMIRLANQREDVESLDFSHIYPKDRVQGENEILESLRIVFDELSDKERYERWQEQRVAADSTDPATISLQTIGSRYTLVDEENFQVIIMYYNDFLYLMYKTIVFLDIVEITITFEDSVVAAKTFSGQSYKGPYLMVLFPAVDYLNKILQLRINDKNIVLFKIHHEYIGNELL